LAAADRPVTPESLSCGRNRTVSNLDQFVTQAKEYLDSQTREMVEWHFDPETGSPFWLEKSKEFDFDPRKDVQCFEDLKKFPLFEDEWLRGGPVRRWVPKA
jgi:hypothetical protein